MPMMDIRTGGTVWVSFKCETAPLKRLERTVMAAYDQYMYSLSNLGLLEKYSLEDFSVYISSTYQINAEILDSKFGVKRDPERPY
jgi:hypothetical protein